MLVEIFDGIQGLIWAGGFAWSLSRINWNLIIGCILVILILSKAVSLYLVIKGYKMLEKIDKK